MRAFATALLFASAAFSQDRPAQDRLAQEKADLSARWKSIEFLFGNWTAKGGGTSAGQGAGDFSFEPQVNRQIVIRKNFAEYTSGPEAGIRHDDLMIIYADAPGQPLRAIYFDSEGHTIRYNVERPSANVAVFESDGTQPGPKYKLSYELHGKELVGKFEVGDKTYLTWNSVKK
jgi:hypothetical protein